MNPPLVRVAAALLPFLDGLRSAGHEDLYQDGNAILHTRGAYMHNLSLARWGVLPFFLLASGLVWYWSRSLYGDVVALLATALFTTLPTILAHAGLATNDMGFTAMFIAVLVVFIRWLDHPTIPGSLLLGVVTGLCILAKLSALLFLPACGVGILALRWMQARQTVKSPETGSHRWSISIVLMALVIFFVIWGGYRFSVGSLTTPQERPHTMLHRFIGTDGALHDLVYAIVEAPIIPAPQFIHGILQLQAWNARGHQYYLLGQDRTIGVWYFFPLL